VEALLAIKAGIDHLHLDVGEVFGGKVGACFEVELSGMSRSLTLSTPLRKYQMAPPASFSSVTDPIVSAQPSPTFSAGERGEVRALVAALE
jgi:hypothetical protein